jgi:tRNA threonylcarbamoyladenosine biosynthesis protein TsaE
MIINSHDDMMNFGAQLALKLVAGDWIAINGTLGAGKTVLCAGILRGLGFSGEVASPSYAIVHQYDVPDVHIPVTHADLYRINDLDEIAELGLTDGRDDCITLIEWAKNGGDLFGAPTHIIDITITGAGARRINMKEYNG